MSDKKEFSELYDDFYAGWSGFLNEANLDLEMHLGAHFTSKQVNQAKITGRTLYPFNKTARQVDLLSGYEIRNQHVLKIGPIGEEDDDACRQHTALVMLQMAKGGYNTLSDCFKWGSLVTGSTLFELYKDRSGQLKFNRRPYNTFLPEPGFSRRDLSDCRNILTGDWLSDESIRILLPAQADKIKDIKPSGAGRWINPAQYWTRHDKRLFEQWWQRQVDFVPMVINRINGNEVPFKAISEKIGARALNSIIKELKMPNGMPVFSKYEKPVNWIKLRIYVDGEMVFEGGNPLGLDDYNFVWVAGEYAPECDRDELKLRSLTRRMRQPQHARDKRINQAIDIIESSINSGKVIKEDSLVNDEDAYKTGQGHVIWVKRDYPGALLDAVQQMTAANIPAGIFQMIELLDREETQTTGLNDEIFGSDDKDIPGILHKYRTGQALTAHQGTFSDYRFSKSQIGMKLVQINQKLEPEQVFRMINEWPARGFYEPDFTKYDCTPTEGLLTDGQRHLWFIELKALYQLFPEKIPASYVLEAAPVQYKKELLDKVRQQEQMQSYMMQAQLETKRSMDFLMQAQAVENLAQAQESRTGAVLDRAKSIVEIQKVQAEPRLQYIDRYLKILELMQNNLRAPTNERQ